MTSGETTTPRAGYRQAVYSEMTKVLTVRSTLVLIGLLGAALPALAVLIAVTKSLQPDDTILGASVLGGAVIAQILAATLGTIIVTGEYRTGSVVTTLTACPRRLTVLASKATVAAGVSFVVVLPSSALAYGLGVALLDGDIYATGQPFPALIGVAAAVASISALGIGVGTLLRNSAGAAAAVVFVILLPEILAPLFGNLQRWIGGASTSGVLQKLTQSSDATHETVGSLTAWPSLALVVAYTAAAVLGAAWILRHRDV